ncbi:lipocalin-like domain-containing protein [Marivita sp. GX14005]|uniref:lipocalin-like domain-containing protein n=1 Tax=Marivita sp. GX14005 TaxID=2942276 RepID=UPI002018D536|nr:lipocalin-like domain-containing protein [Marivita sp. GX14005]MCL3882597.1 iron ABC transporter permease [Marivita sp. GX14005]
MIARICALLLWLPCTVAAQGFAGLGTDAEGFAVPQPDPQFTFPEDHGAHPAYRIEWWYLTANLQSADGTEYGVQWTLFRSALAPETREGWQDPQVWFAHAAVTTPERHLVAERIARGGIGQAGVTAQPFRAWIDDWHMAGPDLDELTLTASGDGFRYRLDLVAQGPLVFHGQEGYSVKSALGQASYYYSQPFFEVQGTLLLPEGEVEVAGSAWLDREWSSQPLAETQSGWDWFSLSFESGDKLMGFLLRDEAGTSYGSASWITAAGQLTAYPDGAFEAEPLRLHRVAGRDVPVAWSVRLPDRGVDLTVEALNPDAWMAVGIPYWEGPVQVRGSHQGRGYLEMTGYESRD